MRRLLTMLAVLLVCAAQAITLSPQQESRAREVGKNIRCPVCRGLPLTESPNELSDQMFAQVREQVAQGRTNDEIYAYFASRYGQSVLLRPDARGVNLLLWGVPVLVLGGGAVVLVLWLRGAAGAPAAPDARALARLQSDLDRPDLDRPGPSGDRPGGGRA